MKRLSNCFLYLFFAALIIFLAACNSDNKTDYGQATRELITLVENNSDVESLLIASIEKARQINPDRNTNPVQNLDEYYEFVSWAETSLPWALLKKEEYPEIFDNIFQSLCYFYFLIKFP